jgi:hypothetical protein
MDTRKIEHIIIIILALLNLCLLTASLTDTIQARRADRKTRAELTALLAADGIRLGEDAVLLQETPAVCSVVRDMDAEQARMDALLGESVVEDLGGAIRFYRAAHGQAVLRGTGEIDLLLTGGSVSAGGNRDSAAEKLFASAGVATCAWDSPADGDLVRCCLWDGLPVFNARLSFDFSGGNLSMVTGTLVLNRETKRSTEGVLNAASVLARFLEIVRTQGYICSTLESLTPGYLMTVAVSGESTLTPVWRLVTDTGALYLNALTGQTETVS